MASSEGRPLKGAKRPRAQYLGLPNYSIVNFLDEGGEKTKEQEIVPTLWIINGQKPHCHWPKNVSRKQLDVMVLTEEKPNREKFMLFPVRIMKTGLTYTDAKESFDALASKSNDEDAHLGDANSGADDSSESDKEMEKDFVKKKKKKGRKSKKPKSKNLNDLESFEYLDEEDSDRIMDELRIQPNTINSNKGSAKSPLKVNTSIASGSRESLKSPEERGTKSDASSSTLKAVKQLFHQPLQEFNDHVTKGEFKVFETKLFHKLNSILVKLDDKKAAAVMTFPKSVSDVCTLPAQDIYTLETLDNLLQNANIRTEIAQYLAQLGGKTAVDFLSRALSKVISDKLCYLTNWSGSAIPSNSLDHDGGPITREFKKTFSNLLNIIAMFCESCRQVHNDFSDKKVESYIKSWLLHYKDRLNPRTHGKTDETKTPRKLKASPKKRRVD